MKLNRITRIVALFVLSFVTIFGLTSCDAYEQWLLDNVYKSVQDADLNIDVTKDKPELNVIFPASGLSDDEFKNGWITGFFQEQTGYKVNYEQFSSDETGYVTDIMMNQKEYHMMKLQSPTYFPLMEEKEENFTDRIKEIYNLIENYELVDIAETATFES